MDMGGYGYGWIWVWMDMDGAIGCMCIWNNMDVCVYGAIWMYVGLKIFYLNIKYGII